MARISKKRLESELEQLDTFEDPRVDLEQYCTPAGIAAEMLHAVNMDSSLKGMKVLDIGCGTGILGLGSVLLGADKVFGIDIDSAALKIAEQNCDYMELSRDQVAFLKCDVRNMTSDDLPATWKEFDLVICNPPFGTQDESTNVDFDFVSQGLKFANKVYSLHKSSTRKFWRKKALEMGIEMDIMNPDLRFPIRRTFKFHKHDVGSVIVDLIKFSKH